MSDSDQITKDEVTHELVLGILPKFVREILNKDDNEIFINDYEFIRHTEAIQVILAYRSQITNNVEDRVFQWNSEDFGILKSFNVSNIPKISETLLNISDILLNKRDKRLEEQKKQNLTLPRLIRIEDAFEFSKIERIIFEYMMMAIVSEPIQKRTMYGGFGRNGTTGLTYSNNLNIELADIKSFFHKDRKHIKEGVVPSMTHIHHTIGSLSESLVSILLGQDLSSSDFLSLESTTIQNIIKSEEGFKNTDAGKSGMIDLNVENEDDEIPISHPKLEKQGSSSYLEQLRDENQDKEETLYQILKREELREKEEWIQENVKNGNINQYIDINNENKDNLSDLLPPGMSNEDIQRVVNDMGGLNLLNDNQINLEDKKDDNDIDDDNIDNKNNKIEEESNEGKLLPYKNDLQYLQDQFLLVVSIMKLSKAKRAVDDMDDMDDEKYKNLQMGGYQQDLYDPITGRMLGKDQLKQKKESTLKKLKSKEKVLRSKVERRLELTKKTGGWLPRLERLASALNLVPFEKNAIISMIGAAIAPTTVNFQALRNGQGGFMGNQIGSTRCTVSDLLDLFTTSLEEQIRYRKYFYKSATLIKEAILNLSGLDFATDLTACSAEIDRRMLDFIVGLDTEFSEIVDGSHLYTPEVDLNQVILPEETKNLIMETVQNFDSYKLVQKNVGFDEKLSYGKGMVLLFYGTSGTGKTMMANALATTLNKKILLVNWPFLGNNEAGAIVKMIFREAKINDAILFFDECESVFQSRNLGSNRVNMILTELERHDGLCILASNRAQELDEAMYRRITLAIEFQKPDHLLRKKIWESLCPSKLNLDEDVNLSELALKYELTGGFIKNSWLTALSIAVARSGMNPVVNQKDLKKGASHQLRGRLQMHDFDRKIVPTRGLDDVILKNNIKTKLNEIISYGKAHTILYGQWGFSAQHGRSRGIAALFHGPPGTGKTMAAEAIGYDLGKPLKVINCAQLLSKWVGESQKNIDSVFKEAKAVDAVLVFDEAEGLFGTRNDNISRHDMMNVGVLLHHIETFEGIAIVITNMADIVDSAFYRRFKFMLKFEMPGSDERAKLWRLLIPKEAPLEDSVDFNILANRFEMAGGNIKAAVFRAAARAALRTNVDERIITMNDLLESGEEEMAKDKTPLSSIMNMYS